MSILLTGDSGFVGTHVQNKTEVIPFCDQSGKRINICDPKSVTHFCNGQTFDFVIHLAAISSVPESFEDPLNTFHTNFIGTLNLLNGLKSSGFKGRFLYVGSSDTYGIVDSKTLPVREEHLQKPRNPYAVSKLAAEALCYQWSQTDNFEIIIARPFNHIGVDQSERFAVSNFAKQIAMKRSVIEVGDIKVTRDFTDVNDVIRAYLLLLERGKNGAVYNVCSGIERSLEEILDQLIKISGIEAKVIPLSDRFRSVEQRRIFGSFEKLNKDTGWSPQIPFIETLHNILQGWESKLLCESKR